MSIYATLWTLKFPQDGDDYWGRDWVEVTAQAVPPHIGSPTPGCGYGGGDPFADFLPPPVDGNGGIFRAVVFIKEGTPKGTARNPQEYGSPLLVLTGEEYSKIRFEDLCLRIQGALREDVPRLSPGNRAGARKPLVFYPATAPLRKGVLPEEQPVELWPIHDLFGMIVRGPSGIKWSNQVGGVACRHPIVEGIFVPLPAQWFKVNSIEDEIGFTKFDKDLKAHNRRVAGKFLGENPEIRKRFVFDGDFDGSAAEAWVPLRVRPSDDEILKPFVWHPVVLTYENSD